MESNRSESSKGKKRLRESDTAAQTSDIDQILSLEKNLTFSDTQVALRIIRAHFPHIDKVSIQPFILRSQLYSSVKDRTQVDRELELLKRDKVLRIFKLFTGQDDHAVMFSDDYLNQVECVVKRLEEKKLGNLEVLEWFKSHVIDSKLEPSIEHQELCTLLSLGGKVKDEHISVLINAGLLTRQLIDQNLYWFAIPNIGSVLKGLSQYSWLLIYLDDRVDQFINIRRALTSFKDFLFQGRKEVLSLLNRRRYKEMMLGSLEKKRLRLSPLDMRFHLRDLIGSGHLKTVQTPTGVVVQVSKD